MWIGHYFMGLGFYVVANVATWIDAAPLIQARMTRSYGMVESIRTVALVAFWLLASVMQAKVHSYLTNMTRGLYTIPQFPKYTGDKVVSPHYGWEIVIYALMAVMLLDGQGNLTMICVAVFVAVNLSVTAAGTYEWYRTKFGEDAVRGKFRMIPNIW
jgi:3-oxo-5-alpha-steroid 4-dehydrogenase 3